MARVYPLKPLKYRSIWISDVHLGSRGCKAEYLLEFLKSTQSDTLYLVGDIIDTWAMKNGLYWPQAHNNVIRTILGKSKRGTKVIYVPGNHDEPFRDHVGMRLGNVEIRREYVHTTHDGRRLLVMHGDEFDSIIKCSKLVAVVGSRAYDLLVIVNRWVNLARRRFGLPYWSLAKYLKHRVKNAVNHISNFEHAVAHEAARRKVDGLVCGHIHHPEMRQIGDVLYCNDGDWVESCTALVEHHGGALEILHWSDSQETVKAVPATEYGAATAT